MLASSKKAENFWCTRSNGLWPVFHLQNCLGWYVSNRNQMQIFRKAVIIMCTEPLRTDTLFVAGFMHNCECH